MTIANNFKTDSNPCPDSVSATRGGLVALLQGFQANDTIESEITREFSRSTTSPVPIGLCRAKTSSGRFCERYRARVRGSRGFTLAEVLITLGIIGVVAAITIPPLMTNIQSKVTEHQRKVANARLIEGLNMLNIKENGLSVRYNNTEEFVRALSKHMKLVQICGSGELDKCFPYENINYESGGEVKQAKVSSLKTPARLKLTGDGWLEPAGFITANGIPYIISFNNNCSGATDANGTTIIDPDRPLPCNKDTGCQIPYQCIDGIYDLNGSRTPNKFDKDIETIHSASRQGAIFCTAFVVEMLKQVQHDSDGAREDSSKLDSDNSLFFKFHGIAGIRNVLAD